MNANASDVNGSDAIDVMSINGIGNGGKSDVVVRCS